MLLLLRTRNQLKPPWLPKQSLYSGSAPPPTSPAAHARSLPVEPSGKSPRRWENIRSAGRGCSHPCFAAVSLQSRILTPARSNERLDLSQSRLYKYPFSRSWCALCMQAARRSIALSNSPPSWVSWWHKVEKRHRALEIKCKGGRDCTIRLGALGSLF